MRVKLMESKVQTEKLIIDKVVGGGLGLGRLENGMVVMLPYVLPGEEVIIKPLRRRKKYLEAELVEVVKPSPQRTTPSCPHFAICGGCDLQHATYAYQLELKEAILREQLLGSKVVDSDRLAEVLVDSQPAPEPLGYRQRLRLQIDESGGYGFFHHRSHDVERISSCPLARPEINQVMERFPDSQAMDHLLPLSKELELLSSPGDGSLVLIFHLRRKPRPSDQKAAGQLVDDLDTVKAVYLAAKGIQVLGPYCGTVVDSGDEEKSLLVLLPFPEVTDHGVKPYTLCQEAGGFSQVNLEQNNGMIHTMLDWAGELAPKRALDLYSGMGNFSIPLAAKAEEVLGLDLQRAAIRSGARNAEAAGMTNCTFQQRSALDGIKEMAEAGEVFDLLLLDPPRRGCREVLPYLEGIGSPAVIYISCDPATLARDIKDMSELGYSLEKVQLVDMFPQTHHLETIALLRK
jgi:23S rRNA (uracil1939-C5)-methyltransferase